MDAIKTTTAEQLARRFMDRLAAATTAPERAGRAPVRFDDLPRDEQRQAVQAMSDAMADVAFPRSLDVAA